MDQTLLNYFELSMPFSQQQLKAAYRRLAAQHHPDKGGDTKSFQVLQANYQRALPYCDARAETLKQCKKNTSSKDFETILQETATWQQQVEEEAVRQAAQWQDQISDELEGWWSQQHRQQRFRQELIEVLGLENPVTIEYLDELLYAKQHNHRPNNAWQAMLDKYGQRLARILLPWSVAQDLQHRVFG